MSAYYYRFLYFMEVKMPNIKIEKVVVGDNVTVGDIFEVTPIDHPTHVMTYKVISIEDNFLECEEIELQEINTSCATDLEVIE